MTSVKVYAVADEAPLVLTVRSLNEINRLLNENRVPAQSYRPPADKMPLPKFETQTEERQ